MDRDHFIIAVYCLVCQHYQALTQQRRLRQAGFAPALTDEEVITMELCGEYFKLNADKDIFAYFRGHYRHFFPALSERTLFVRQAADLSQLKAALQRRLVHLSGQDAAPFQPVDTLPLPVCVYTRSRRDRCFKPEADYGYCAAKKLHYYGFKLGLRVSRCGMITDFGPLSARAHDLQHLPTLVQEHGGLVPADKGFTDAYTQALLAQRQGTQVVTPPRARMQTPHAGPLLRACARWRKRVETVGSQLTGRFAVARLRVHDLRHYLHRLIRKVPAHTVAVFLNLQMGRKPLDLDGLVTA